MTNGQRTGKEILHSAWTPEEEALLAQNGVSKDEVIKHWIMDKGSDSLTSAIGAVLMSRDGRGSEERNMPNQTQEEADASVKPSEGAAIENVGDLTTPPETTL